MSPTASRGGTVASLMPADGAPETDGPDESGRRRLLVSLVVVTVLGFASGAGIAWLTSGSDDDVPVAAPEGSTTSTEASTSTAPSTTSTTSASTTSTVVHVHDHDHVHDYVSRRRTPSFSRRTSPRRHLWPLHHGAHRPAVKFPGYYM